MYMAIQFSYIKINSLFDDCLYIQRSFTLNSEYHRSLPHISAFSPLFEAIAMSSVMIDEPIPPPGACTDSGGYDDEHRVLLPRDSELHDTGADPQPHAHGMLLLIGPVLLAGIIVKAFDIAFLATSYTRISSDLKHFKDGSWIMLTASICSAVFVPLYSYLLKSFGVKSMMIIAYGTFALGAGLCGTSVSFWQLLASRFVLGFGSSGVTLLSMIIINEIVGKKQLALWESFVTCIEMAASMSAGPLGATISRHFTWHSVFFLEMIFMSLGLGLVYVSFAKLSSFPVYSQSLLLRQGDSQLPRIDTEGWILLILAVTTPLIAVTLGDNLINWTHSAEIVLLICGPVFIALFVGFEAKVASNPIVDMTPIFKIDYLRVLFQVFFVISIINSVVFILPPYIQVRAFEGSAFEDWALTCIFLGLPVGAITGGYMIQRDSFPLDRVMLVNSIILESICVLFRARIAQPEIALHAPFLVGFGVCAGIWQSCLLYATVCSTDKQWWPQTMAIYYLIETTGGDLGIALMSAITRSIVKAGIRSSLGQSEATEQIITNALQDLGSIRRLDNGPRAAVLSEFEYAMHTSFFLPCVMGGLVIISATYMNMRLHEPRHKRIIGNE
ncbi:major facilitator superfamily domain-containing protein [Camillea tinctor]|nr:major facilitator superfamily domain-containing protein [Camillea tinctor]